MINALQVTNLNFYGDYLIAIKDNATGEIYAAINHILRNIGFNEKQIEYQRKKFTKDVVISKGTRKFSGVEINMPSIDGIWCISNRKLPIALTKIMVTPKMKQTQPELAYKLELYQDKCADVLASVFIDDKAQYINIEPLMESISNITNALSSITDRLSILEQSSKKPLPANKYSRWKTMIFKKLNTLTSYVNENSDENLSMPRIMGLVYNETQDTYDIDFNDYTDMYRCEYGLQDDVKVQTLDVINHYKDIRDMFTLTLDSIMDKLHLQNESDMQHQNIFDILALHMGN